MGIAELVLAGAVLVNLFSGPTCKRTDGVKIKVSQVVNFNGVDSEGYCEIKREVAVAETK